MGRTPEAKPKAKPPRKILCSHCGEMTSWEGNPWRPFCCERCKIADLGAWADESYRIPTQDTPGDGEGED